MGQTGTNALFGEFTRDVVFFIQIGTSWPLYVTGRNTFEMINVTSILTLCKHIVDMEWSVNWLSTDRKFRHFVICMLVRTVWEKGLCKYNQNIYLSCAIFKFNIFVSVLSVSAVFIDRCGRSL